MEGVLSKLRGFLKVLLALAIPVGIGSFFWYAQKQADTQLKEFQQAQKENPNTDKVTVDNYELKEVGDDNQIKWQLVAERGVMLPTNKDVELKNVKVEYFDGKKIKMRIIAPAGTANEQTRYVKLDSADGHRVLAEGEEGKAKMEASKIELKEKNQFVATGGVNIVWPGVAKVTGNQASGVLGKGAEMKDVKIVGNTHALVGHI
ncbi:MAG TPA: LPS export ABC transporter periplasmic protein LptC [Chroococcales cyanobacterium]